MSQWLPADPWPNPPPQRGPLRSRGLIVAIVVGGSIMGVGVLCLLCLVGIVAISFSGVARRQLTEAEKGAFLSIRDLKRFGVQVANPLPCEVYAAKRNVDGSWEFEYDFDPERVPTPETICSLDSEVEVYRSPVDAEEGFHDRLAAYHLGEAVSGASLVKEGTRYLGVDDSYCASYQQNGRRFGHVLVVRKGERVASIMLIGLVLDDPRELEWLVETTMGRATTFQIQ